MSITPGPIMVLRKAILAHLQANASLGALMGGTLRLHDEAPRAAKDIYATFGDASVEDWSTATTTGHVHKLAIVVWSKPGSARNALEVAEAMASLLDDTPLTMSGHRLVLLAITSVALDRDARSQLGRTTVQLKALTEQL
jgi:Protein of unknown function (DUF3168)